MKRFFKYAATVLVVFMLIPLTTNAQTIKRSKQKTEQRSKPNQEKQAKNSGSKKKQSSQSNTPKRSKACKRPVIKAQNKYKKSVISDKRINQLILDLIDNMVYVQVKDLRYSADQYKNRTRNPFDKNAKGSEASCELVGGFYICKYEVTQELWAAVMGYNPSTFSNQGSSQNPVENVTWEECQEFIYELNDLVRGSVDFRMPTEEEWEYAAKGGQLSNGNKYSGSAAPQRVAWYERNSNGTTHQVGTMKPNELGLYDMSGNVSEWCETLFDRYYDEDEEYEMSPYYNPDTRACRGGSWNDNNANCGIKSRYEYDVDIEKPTIGLRLAASQIDPYE